MMHLFSQADQDHIVTFCGFCTRLPSVRCCPARASSSSTVHVTDCSFSFAMDCVCDWVCKVSVLIQLCEDGDAHRWLQSLKAPKESLQPLHPAPDKETSIEMKGLVDEEAAVEAPRCPKGHVMARETVPDDEDVSCDRCSAMIHKMIVWSCTECEYDVCDKCAHPTNLSKPVR